jgi:hypothetical protein
MNESDLKRSQLQINKEEYTYISWEEAYSRIVIRKDLRRDELNLCGLGDQIALATMPVLPVDC